MLGRTNETKPEKEAFLAHLAHLERLAEKFKQESSQSELKRSGFANTSMYGLLNKIIEISQLEPDKIKACTRIEKWMKSVYDKLNVLMLEPDFFTSDYEAAYYVLFLNMTLIPPKIKECMELLQGLKKDASPGELIILNKIEQMLNPPSQNTQKNMKGDVFDEIKKTPLDEKGRIPKYIIRYMQLNNACKLLIKITSHTHNISSYLNKIAEFARMQYLPEIKMTDRKLFDSFKLIYDVRQDCEAFLQYYIVIHDPKKSLMIKMNLSLMQLFMYYSDRVENLTDPPFDILLPTLAADAFTVATQAYYITPPDEILPFWKTMIRIYLTDQANERESARKEYQSLFDALRFMHDFPIHHGIKTPKEQHNSFAIFLRSFESKYNFIDLKPGFLNLSFPVLIGILPKQLLKNLTALKDVIAFFNSNGLQKKELHKFQQTVLRLSVQIGADSASINELRAVFSEAAVHKDKKAEEPVLSLEKNPAEVDSEIALYDTDKLNKAIDDLYASDQTQNVEPLLLSVIKNPDRKAQYEPLLYLIRFVERLPDKDINSCTDKECGQIQMAFFVLLHNVTQNIYDFSELTSEFLSNFPHLVMYLKEKSMQKREFLNKAIIFFQEKNIVNEREPLLFVESIFQQVSELLASTKLLETTPSQTMDSNHAVVATHDEREKKLELDRPDFIPDETLTTVIEYYSTYLDYNEEKVELQDRVLYKLPSYLIKRDLDENNAKLINLFYRLFNITKSSHKTKINGSYNPKLFSEIDEFYKDIVNIKDNNKFLLPVLLNNPGGRDFLYHVLLQRIISKEPDIELTRFIITSLKDTSDKTVEEGVISEVEVLEYFEFLLDELFKKSNLKQQDTYLENKLVNIHKALNFDKKENLKTKVEFLNHLKSSLLIFNKKIRKFVIQFVTINLGFSGIKDLVENTPELPDLITLTTDLSGKNYYPAVLSKSNGSTLDYVVLKILNFIRYTEIYADHNALVNAPNANILQLQINYLKIQMIQIISKLPSLGCIHYDDFKIISEEAPYVVIYDCLEILKIEDKLQIYNSIITMLLFLLPSHADDFYNRVNKIIDCLFINKKYGKVIHFLKPLNASDHPSKEIYISFLTAIYFLCDIQLNINSLNVVLTNIKDNKYDFSALTSKFLSNKFENVASEFKKAFLTLIKSLDIVNLKKSADKKQFLQFQQVILKLAEILGLDRKDLADIWKKIQFNPDSILDDPAFANKSSSTGKKVKQQKKQPEEKKSAQDSEKKAATPKPTVPEVSIKNKPSVAVQEAPVNLNDDPGAGDWEAVTKNKKHDKKNQTQSRNEKKPNSAPKKLTVPPTTRAAASTTTSRIQSTSSTQNSTTAITMQTSTNIKDTTKNVATSAQETRTTAPTIQSNTHTTLATSTSTQSRSKTTNSVGTPIPVVTKANQINVSSTHSTTTVTTTKAPTTPKIVTAITAAPIPKVEQKTSQPVAASKNAITSAQATHTTVATIHSSTHTKLATSTSTSTQSTSKTTNLFSTPIPAVTQVSQINAGSTHSTTTATAVSTAPSNATKEVAASPLLSGTLFKASNEDKTLVEQKRLPEDLLVFSEFYHCKTNKTLTLIDGAVACLLSRNDYPLHSDMVACSDGYLLHCLLTSEGYNCEISNAIIPNIVVSIPVNIHGQANTYKFNITCCGEDTDIIQFLASRDKDLDVATVSMQLVPKAGCFKINGPTQALNSLFNGTMSPAYTNIYDENPIRIFQLVLRRGKFPNLRMSHALNRVLMAIPRIVDTFIYNDTPTLTHLRQFNTNIDIAFSTLDTKLAVYLLCKCNIVTGLIGLTKLDAIINSAEYLDPYMKIFSNDKKKTAFYHFLYMHAWFSDEPIKKMELFSRITYTLERNFEAPAFEQHLEIIRNSEDEAMSKSRRFKYVPPFEPAVEFTNMLNSVYAFCQKAKTSEQEAVHRSRRMGR